uniref:Uncharacterized protein n=1 Tax=Arundo donax TaxID=35708 RepID=A0A0A8ZZR9_ARUDO
MPLKLMKNLATVEIHSCQLKIYIIIHKRHPVESLSNPDIILTTILI